MKRGDIVKVKKDGTYRYYQIAYSSTKGAWLSEAAYHKPILVPFGEIALSSCQEINGTIAGLEAQVERLQARIQECESQLIEQTSRA